LYHEPEKQRQDKILRLLQEFVRQKHNDTSTRTQSEQGWKEINSQIVRAVKMSIRLNPSCRSASLELFARIRQKRQQGRYKRVICLEGLLTGVTHTTLSPLSPFTCMLTNFAPLPSAMQEAIKRVAGRMKVFDFATKLLNLLHENKGSMNIGQKELSDLLGYESPAQMRKYRQVLIKAGLLHLGAAYSTGSFAKRHSLTKAAKEMFEKAKAQNVEAV
jgi:hypothetical protein